MDAPPPSVPPVIPTAPAAHPGSDKLWSIFCHLSLFTGLGTLVVPLVVYLVMKKESEFVGCNAREALNFHISLFIYGICCIPLFFVCGIGMFLGIAIWVASWILAIIATIKAADDGCYHYPLTLQLVS